MSPNARAGGDLRGLSANEYSCAHGAQLKFGDLTPWPIPSPNSVHGRGVQPGHRHTRRHHAWATGEDPGSTKSVLCIRIQIWIQFRIRIQGFDDQKLKDEIKLKIFCNFFLIKKIAIYWSLGFDKRRPIYLNLCRSTTLVACTGTVTGSNMKDRYSGRYVSHSRLRIYSCLDLSVLALIIRKPSCKMGQSIVYSLLHSASLNHHTPFKYFDMELCVSREAGLRKISSCR